MKAQCSAAWVAPVSTWRGLEALRERKWVLAADAGYSKTEDKAGLGWYVAEFKSRQVLMLVGTILPHTCRTFQDVSVLET